MNSFEIFLLCMLCASFIVGPLVGYRAGRVDRSGGWRDEYRRGYRSGWDNALTVDGELLPQPLPKAVTQAMPVVSVTVNGDEVDLSPKRARDVGRPE